MTLAILEELRQKGVDVVIEGDGLCIKGPKRVVTKDVIETVKTHKPEIMRALSAPEKPVTPEDGSAISPDAEATAAEIDALCALGGRLRRGEIKAIRCGITGEKCYACGGVPCRGSEPWEEIK